MWLIKQFINRLVNRRSQSVIMALLVLIAHGTAAAEWRNLSLWTIDHEDARVYLLGSIHAMKVDMYPLPSPIIEAFNASEVTVFEVDLTSMDRSRASKAMQTLGTYTPPASIKDDLQPATIDLLITYLREQKISLSQVRYMKPWHLSLNIGVMELTRLGYETELGLDHYLQKLAREQGKEVRQLESYAEQIRILSSDPVAIQDLALRVSLRERHTIKDELEQMIGAWRRGDVDMMYKLTLDSVKEYPLLQQQMNRLVSSRNEKMTTKIREYLATKRIYLVVAGALHMGGPDGIINLLAQDYEVKQVSY